MTQMKVKVVTFDSGSLSDFDERLAATNKELAEFRPHGNKSNSMGANRHTQKTVADIYKDCCRHTQNGSQAQQPCSVFSQKCILGLIGRCKNCRSRFGKSVGLFFKNLSSSYTCSSAARDDHYTRFISLWQWQTYSQDQWRKGYLVIVCTGLIKRIHQEHRINDMYQAILGEAVGREDCRFVQSSFNRTGIARNNGN